MPIKETKTETVFEVARIEKTTGSHVGLQTIAVDTANFDKGVTFFLEYTVDAGTYDFSFTDFKEDDDSGMVEATAIPTNNIIGNLSDFNLSSPTLDGAIAPSIGIIGTKRYVQFTFDLTIAGGAPIISYVITAVKSVEVVPSS